MSTLMNPPSQGFGGQAQKRIQTIIPLLLMACDEKRDCMKESDCFDSMLTIYEQTII